MAFWGLAKSLAFYWYSMPETESAGWLHGWSWGLDWQIFALI
jgi:hypothetical protein